MPPLKGLACVSLLTLAIAAPSAPSLNRTAAPMPAPNAPNDFADAILRQHQAISSRARRPASIAIAAATRLRPANPAPLRATSADSPNEKRPRAKTLGRLHVAGIYSGLTPAAFTAGTHLSIDALSCARRASGVASCGVGRSTASSVRRLTTLGSASVVEQRLVDLGDDLLRRALGREEAVPDRDLVALRPAASIVGTSGSCGRRFRVDDAQRPDVARS